MEPYAPLGPWVRVEHNGKGVPGFQHVGTVGGARFPVLRVLGYPLVALTDLPEAVIPCPGKALFDSRDMVRETGKEAQSNHRHRLRA